MTMPAAGRLRIGINNQQTTHRILTGRLRTAAREVLLGEGVCRATISLAIVDDPTMHRLNREHLQHDYPTDVLSFLLDREEGFIEGEVIVSADTAANSCGEYGWSTTEELVLYVVHGMLHLVGYDDHSPEDRLEMRAKEVEYLARMGIKPPDAGSRSP